MNVQILQLIDGACKAKGLTVVIDVFRAFTTACYLASQGALKIIPLGDIKLAYQLKKQNPGYILIGERNERIPEGFDYGNSPTFIKGIDFSGKTIVHTTSAGTQGLVNATNASEVITGSFVNAPAIVRYIQQKQPHTVSLVCMGYAAIRYCNEDTFCAEYIKNALLGLETNLAEMVEILKVTDGKRLFEPQNQAHSPESDFYMCTETGKFNFVLKSEMQANGLMQLVRVNC